MTKDLVKSLQKDGYVLIPSALTDPELIVLRAAAERTVTLARSGKWPYIRTLPKQFPPWGSDPSNGIWGVQHLLNPELPDSDIFALSYFADFIINPVKELLDAKEDDLIMELYNVLVRPDSDFELRWHRDDIAADATAEEEMKRLQEPAWHAQWNLALYDDHSLVVVPGTHQRARTDEERNADPLDKNMPGQKVVEMKAGDLVFYNNNILHRGVYDSHWQRMTLHGSIGHVKGSRMRARNVLQHGVGEWVEKCNFELLPGNMRTRAEGMRARLYEMGQEANGDVGYAHED
ncbi:phytanoyl-CoA dioxygenase family protein [Rhizodiscina lignyota]|uniref:Phytanoyl-CoA dioxygenase family protein n=1 Tax=Rhizodiscina lignyota TaxID=1504668 RepID=A0A9P4M2V8_9PEZI|nr:phytanoyl-CoA dioxygenase family protein [Rhizodiscina lignyota]